MTNLTLITPVTRPENLKAISESIRAAIVPGIELYWKIVFDASEFPVIEPLPDLGIVSFHVCSSTVDGDRVGISGNPQRNHALDLIESGWVYFLDDDTTLHPGLLKAIAPLLNHIPGCNLVVNQDWPDGKRRCTIGPDRLCQGSVDTGQVVLDRESIGAIRWETSLYEADGTFIESVLKSHPGSFIFLNQSLSIYNSLR